MCAGVEQRAAGHRTLDTGSLDGIRRYDGDPGAGPRTTGPNIRVSCFNPSWLWWQCPCLPAVSTLQQSGCCGDNEICFLPGPSSRARQSAAPCHGPAAGTSFLRRNQGPDPHQPTTARATQLQHRYHMNFFLFHCRFGKIINRLLKCESN